MWTLLLLSILAAPGPTAGESGADVEDDETDEDVAWVREIPVSKIQRMVRALERDPLGKDAKGLRSVLFVYVDLMEPEFVVCLDQFAPLFESKKKAHEHLWVHVAIASGSYLLDHPEDLEDEVAYQTAGLEGMLRAYEKMIDAKPKLRHPFLEELVALREAGKLEEHVRANACEDE